MMLYSSSSSCRPERILYLSTALGNVDFNSVSRMPDVIEPHSGPAQLVTTFTILLKGQFGKSKCLLPETLVRLISD